MAVLAADGVADALGEALGTTIRSGDGVVEGEAVDSGDGVADGDSAVGLAVSAPVAIEDEVCDGVVDGPGAGTEASD